MLETAIINWCEAGTGHSILHMSTPPVRHAPEYHQEAGFCYNGTTLQKRWAYANKQIQDKHREGDLKQILRLLHCLSLGSWLRYLAK